MKRMTFGVVALSCCLGAWLLIPVVAQAQYLYPSTPPTLYQPYAQAPSYYPQQQFYYPQQPPLYYPQPQQSYYPQYQPCQASACYYPPAQSSGCWSGGRSSQEQLYRCGLSLLYAHRYHESIQTFQSFLRYYPRSSLADNALYWIGECYYAQKHYRTALSYFQRVRYEYPRGNKVPDAMLKIALSHLSLKQYTTGCRALEDLIACYPHSEAARKAYYSLDRCRGGCNRSACRGYVAPDYSEQGYYGDALLPKNW